MGFWTTLLSDQQCKNCGSYDTVRIYQDDPEWDEAVDYIYRCGYDGTIKKIYKCNKCNEYVLYDHNGQRSYTYR